MSATHKPFKFEATQERSIRLGANAFAGAVLLSFIATWLLLGQLGPPPDSGPEAPAAGYLLLGLLTLTWFLAVVMLWLIVSMLRRQIGVLAESRARNRAIVDNMVDGAIHIDADGCLVALNGAAERMFQLSSTDLRGQPLSTLLATDSRPWIDALFPLGDQAAITDDLVSGARELTGRRQNGAEFPLYLAISGVKTGGYPVFTAIARDLTETRRQMAELAQARDQALAADRAKSQFLAVMSHEIRTPMNGILGMLDLLRDDSLSQRQLDFLDTAERSSNLLLGIINDILDLSKIEAGKLDLQKLDFDLRASIEEVTALIASNARDKPLEVASFVERNVPEQVRGDPYRVRQILLNLMGNAVKFTHEGEVVVQVSAEPEAEDALVVRVQVRDTGIGIKPEVVDNLFRPFTQADASTTRRFGGTGLGLVISKRLVDLMGGEIGVESTPNAGSTFWFTLRLRKSDCPPRYAERDLNGMRMLVVDDNATNRLILENYLGNWGAETESVNCGAEALLALRRATDSERPFALAILDMQMPEMDGIELAERIKGDSSLAGLRLLMLSSLGYPGEDARRAGIGVSLLKPVRQGLLHDAVTKVMDMQHPATGVPAIRRDTAYRKFRTKVLVAEDNAVNQKVVMMMLKRLGVEADVVDNGELAVDALCVEHDYDLVFMDVQMPAMGGVEAATRIREHEKETNATRVPIIAMTAAVTELDRNACMDADMDEFIAKPIKKRHLEAALLRWLPHRAEPTNRSSSEQPGTCVDHG